MNDYFQGIRDRYDTEVTQGIHDGECEFDPTGFYMCHCSKRLRESQGLTKPPSDHLEFPPPDCPECGRAVWHDGDGWRCEPCSLAWSSSGTASSAHFTDDYGDISRCAEHGLRGHAICKRGRS